MAIDCYCPSQEIIWDDQLAYTEQGDDYLRLNLPGDAGSYTIFMDDTFDFLSVEGAGGNLSSVKDRFQQLAQEWSSEISNVSSVGVLTNHPKYQQIVALGWDVVPLLLSDLQRNRGFWFTALSTITGIRPFDPADAGNNKRMTEAWILWGKRKGIV